MRSKDKRCITMTRSKSWLFIFLGIALIATISFLWLISITSNDLRGIWNGFYILVLPFLLIGSAAFCARAGLHAYPSQSYRLIFLGIALLVFACYIMADITAGADGLSFIILLPALVEGLIAALAIIYSMPGKRKNLARLIALMFPVSLLLSFAIGLDFTEERVAQRSGDQIIQALNRYHLDKGKYPLDLSELLPAYLPELSPLLLRDNSGWLYNSNGGVFTLKFNYSPDNRTNGSCAFDSQQPHWNCELTDLRGRPVGFMQDDILTLHRPRANCYTVEAQGGRQSAVPSRWTFVQRERCHHCDSNLL